MSGLVARAARRYVAGDTAAQAVAAAGARPFTIGYWDAGDDSPDDVFARCREAVAAVEGRDAYVSVKAPALGYDEGRLRELGPVHLDALGPDTVDRTWALAERVPLHGVTLPGRWRRSVSDADRVAELAVRVRVVKGQFGEDEVDPREGFVAVVDALHERGVRIAVATHDRELAREALRRAPGAELEQLYGLPPVDQDARVYVPYGHAYLPYALRRLRENPRMAWWLLRDLAAAVQGDRQ